MACRTKTFTIFFRTIKADSGEEHAWADSFFLRPINLMPHPRLHAYINSMDLQNGFFNSLRRLTIVSGSRPIKDSLSFLLNICSFASSHGGMVLVFKRSVHSPKTLEVISGS